MKKKDICSIEAVEVVDYLMTCYRNGVEPSSDKKAEAFEMGIDVLQLKRCMEEVYESEEPGEVGYEYGYDI